MTYRTARFRVRKEAPPSFSDLKMISGACTRGA